MQCHVLIPPERWMSPLGVQNCTRHPPCSSLTKGKDFLKKINGCYYHLTTLGGEKLYRAAW